MISWETTILFGDYFQHQVKANVDEQCAEEPEECLNCPWCKLRHGMDVQLTKVELRSKNLGIYPIPFAIFTIPAGVPRAVNYK